MLLVRSQDIVVAEEANPLEVAPEDVMRQFSESLAHNGGGHRCHISVPFVTF